MHLYAFFNRDADTEGVVTWEEYKLYGTDEMCTYHAIVFAMQGHDEHHLLSRDWTESDEAMDELSAEEHANVENVTVHLDVGVVENGPANISSARHAPQLYLGVASNLLV